MGHSDCRGPRHAYTTMMRYPDGLEVDEGPYCQCVDTPQPASKWNPDDPKALTWQHYERAHWTVQYRFCTDKFPKKLKVCSPGERAAVMQTETTGWHIHMAQARCRCHNNLFQLQNWRREGDLWKYYYNCEKPTCQEREGLCARITVLKNKKEENKYDVQEVEFFCACSEGMMCSAKVLQHDKDELKKTNAGFIEKRCESIRQTGKEKNR
ncbi:hypothetical protein SNE40_014385 [Patella caerulea]